LTAPNPIQVLLPKTLPGFETWHSKYIKEECGEKKEINVQKTNWIFRKDVMRDTSKKKRKKRWREKDFFWNSEAINHAAVEFKILSCLLKFILKSCLNFRTLKKYRQFDQTKLKTSFCS
jgi:hypothetical protein